MSHLPQVSIKNVSGDLSSATPLFAASTVNKRFITSVSLSAAAALNVKLQDTAGTVLIGPIYLAANGSFTFKFCPGAFPVTGALGLNALASASDNCSVTVQVESYSA